MMLCLEQEFLFEEVDQIEKGEVCGGGYKDCCLDLDEIDLQYGLVDYLVEFVMGVQYFGDDGYDYVVYCGYVYVGEQQWQCGGQL